MIRRTLVYNWLHSGSGKTKRAAFADLKRVNQLEKFNQEWKKRDSGGRTLEAVIGSSDFAILGTAWGHRDELFHGENHAGEHEFNRFLPKLISVLDRLHSKFSGEYGFDGWRKKGVM